MTITISEFFIGFIAGGVVAITSLMILATKWSSDKKSSPDKVEENKDGKKD